MYDCPSVNACKPAALIVTVAELLETVPVYVALLRVIVTVWPSSAPEVVTVTVPLLLSSVEFNTAPQDNALVAIALIVGAVVSITNVSRVNDEALFAASVNVIVLLAYVPSGKVLNVTVLFPVEVTVPPERIPCAMFVVTEPVLFVVNT